MGVQEHALQPSCSGHASVLSRGSPACPSSQRRHLTKRVNMKALQLPMVSTALKSNEENPAALVQPLPLPQPPQPPLHWRPAPLQPQPRQHHHHQQAAAAPLLLELHAVTEDGCLLMHPLDRLRLSCPAPDSLHFGDQHLQQGLRWEGW